MACTPCTLDLRQFLSLLTIISISHSLDNVCDVSSCSTQTRYLFYDVNPSEGFNLRRDVYMRFAVLAHKLRNSKHDSLRNIKLVLPPWSHLIHWKFNAVPEHMPWALYFNLKSMQLFAPVIEMHDFFNEIGPKYTSKIFIDEVYVLRHFEDMFETGNFKDRMQIDKCDKQYKINYFYYNNLTSDNVRCLYYHGSATKLDALLLNSTAQAILLDRAEIALHDRFGGQLYWQARRSMRFSEDLRKIANHFRQTFLNSTDKIDGTVLPDDWRQEKPHRRAKGGPYLAIHLRRRDFMRGHPDQVPSIDNAVQQIKQKLSELNLSIVFIATDAAESEYENLVEKLSPKIKAFRYTPTNSVTDTYGDGGVAIIDQIICSHAQFFIGTHESTFSFRIQEEREIMGFPVKSTFNAFCKNNKDCNAPSIWKILH